jgi:hypothetical protein
MIGNGESSDETDLDHIGDGSGRTNLRTDAA